MSGPGQITEYFRNKWQITALLYNFDVNVSELKPEHISWLSATVAPHYLSPDMWLIIVGLASPTGPNKLNRHLSRRRAANVASQIWLLNPQGPQMQTELKVAAGEEAARLAGLPDGIEDERWRGVYLTIYDHKQVPPPPKPPPPPPTKVLRTTYLKYFLTDKTTGVPSTSLDRRADRIAEASRQLGQRLVDLTPNGSRQGFLDHTWTITEVIVTTSTHRTRVGGGLGHSIEWLEIEYVWGPFQGKRYFSKDGGVYREMDLEEMEDWFYHPLKTYRRKY